MLHNIHPHRNYIFLPLCGTTRGLFSTGWVQNYITAEAEFEEVVVRPKKSRKGALRRGALLSESSLYIPRRAGQFARSGHFSEPCGGPASPGRCCTLQPPKECCPLLARLGSLGKSPQHSSKHHRNLLSNASVKEHTGEKLSCQPRDSPDYSILSLILKNALFSGESRIPL